MANNKLKIVFFGTPPFAVNVLEYLLKTQVELVAVVTRPDKSRARSSALMPSAVKSFALQHCPSVPLLQPVKASAEEFARTLQALDADLFVVVAYGQILRKNVLDIPPLGCVNVHASLLPKYRGAAPIQRCLMDGCLETGVTIMLMDEGMDTGPMLAKISMAIPEAMTYGELQEALSQIALKPLWNALRALQQGDALIQPQEEKLATYAPKIETGDGCISWNLPAKEVHDQIRAVTPKPGAWCPIRVREKSMTIRLFGSAPLAMQGEPGAILSQDGKELIVACAQGAVSIREVQLSGKNRVPSRDFLRGYPAAILEL